MKNNRWLRGYGQRSNHLFLRMESTNGNMGTYKTHFICGSFSDFIPEEFEDHHKGRCPKCEAARQSVQPTVESGRGKSDKVSTPAVFSG